jgi:hypothetical protein
MKTASIPESAVIIGDDAYLLETTEITWYQRDPNGLWEVVISSVSMCWGCFGNHSFISGQCWGVLCQCCGGTGWEGEDFEFCAGHPLSSKPATCVENQLPQTAFLHRLKTGLSDLDALREDEVSMITPALVRGTTAKIEIIAKNNRYMALLDRKTENVWCLEAFLPVCKSCGGTGRNQNETEFCLRCGGVKWGELGDLRYCFNHAPGWWTLVGDPIESFTL